MLEWVHEKPNSIFDESRSEQGEPFGFGQNRSWRLGRNKDCCLIAVNRGAEAGMDRDGSWVNTDEPKPMDTRHESEWLIGPSPPHPVWTAESINFQYAEGIGFSFREDPGGVWFESCALGWPNGGRTPETAVWPKADREASSALDASFRISTEESELCLPSGAKG